jgi:hypothetical protein
MDMPQWARNYTSSNVKTMANAGGAAAEAGKWPRHRNISSATGANGKTSRKCTVKKWEK